MTVAAHAARAAGRGSGSPWVAVGQCAAALAMSMGIGRFVYTPILPLMQAQAGLTVSYGATLATLNYAGYLAGAAAAIALPRLLHSALVYRAGMVLMVASLGLMPAAAGGGVGAEATWGALRFLAGVASAVVFLAALTSAAARLRGHGHHLLGWGFGGVGVGIALSGALVLAVRAVSTWRAAWWLSAALALVLAVAAWRLASGPGTGPAAAPDDGGGVRLYRWFVALLASYALEGVGYIIAGTFLVAAVDESSPGWVGSGAWIVVGLAAIPAPALWAALGRRRSRPTLLCAALAVQAVGIALPALVGGVAPAVASAVLFGLTFLAVAAMSLALGAHLQFPRAAALLTTGYSVGQMAGPLVVAPMLHHGYHGALLACGGGWWWWWSGGGGGGGGGEWWWWGWWGWWRLVVVVVVVVGGGGGGEGGWR